MNLLEALPMASRPDALAPGMRQAALLLHTLDTADREWLLQQMPSSQSEPMQRLLAELTELGLPADKQLLDDVLGTAAPASVLPHGSPIVNRLARLSVATAFELLQPEPDRLIAQLLHLGAWPWRDGLLQQLGPTRRRRVQEALQAQSESLLPASPQPRLRDLALLEVFEARARRQLAEPPVRSGAQERALISPAVKSWAQRLQAVLAFGAGKR